MRLGNSDLSILFNRFNMLCKRLPPTPSEAVPQRPWYLAAFDRVLRIIVSNDTDGAASQKDAAKQIEQAYLSRLTKAEEGTITLTGDRYRLKVISRSCRALQRRLRRGRRSWMRVA